MPRSGIDKQSLRRLSDRREPARRALWGALIYIVAGYCWITFSDRLAELWFPDPAMLSAVQTWKGLFFVLLTGVVLFVATLRQFDKDRRLLALQHHQRQALRKRERQLSILMDNLPGMAYRCLFDDHWTMLFVSQGCVRLTGYQPDELIRNRVVSYADLIADKDNSDRVTQEVTAAVARDESFSLEYPVIRKDGSQIWVWERGRGVEGDNGERVLEGIILDVSDRKRLEVELEEMATRDVLTGLYNRREATRLLEEELQRASRYRRSMALLWIDFDHFKDINDTYGHAAGDLVLRSVTRLLAESVRTVDIVGRFGGEEFVVILPEMDARGAAETAERLRQRVSEHRCILGSGVVIPLTVSIGVAVYPDHGDQADRLFASADRAMYQAKSQGRNCVVVAPGSHASRRPKPSQGAGFGP
ncbi:sensor domain-containing diguanylate cyclase [Marinobacter lutaoensis]|mgnify:CR=1 FL=1|jgi:diguanylate cyclase (GGDEF)-like protein/PAS domain S-box-containing protein|uniref:sensor domain-containing diguanylate cyclase n=1 Tax=Marinobacter lutaoensis TaxID=135739 RepID=UPI0015949982|nr:sensor domain-containing diguanylate cyclase [Marinobacter lutaoensis]NVD34271.1 sensor domain-containing diguanylate cyclase [Marinobacter lutaoensis]|tara:strand:- start:7305 stop:8555 length:1251 start_codon:yes stop_codon:yes gene_type:complete